LLRDYQTILNDLWASSGNEFPLATHRHRAQRTCVSFHPSASLPVFLLTSVSDFGSLKMDIEIKSTLSSTIKELKKSTVD